MHMPSRDIASIDFFLSLLKVLGLSKWVLAVGFIFKNVSPQNSNGSHAFPLRIRQC